MVPAAQSVHQVRDSTYFSVDCCMGGSNAAPFRFFVYTGIYCLRRHCFLFFCELFQKYDACCSPSVCGISDLAVVSTKPAPGGDIDALALSLPASSTCLGINTATCPMGASQRMQHRSKTLMHILARGQTRLDWIEPFTKVQDRPLGKTMFLSTGSPTGVSTRLQIAQIATLRAETATK